MVYCTKCGFKNEDDEVCARCGATLQISRVEKRYRRRQKRKEDECFGLPHGGTIAGLIFGIIIILAGVSWIVGFEWEFFWPSIVIIVGILVVAGGVYTLLRRK